MFSASVILAGISTGCSEPTAEAPEAVRTVTATYETRGEITRLPSTDNPTSSLMIRHEAIPDFKNQQGETVGMNTMTMPFPTADGLELAPFAVGDKVQVTFEVFTEAGILGYAATDLTKLAPDAELDFTPLPGKDPAHQHHNGHHHH